MNEPIKRPLRIRDVRLSPSSVRHYMYHPHKHVLFIEESSRGYIYNPSSRGYIYNRAYYKLRCVRCHDAFMVEVDYPGRYRR